MDWLIIGIEKLNKGQALVYEFALFSHQNKVGGLSHCVQSHAKIKTKAWAIGRCTVYKCGVWLHEGTGVV